MDAHERSNGHSACIHPNEAFDYGPERGEMKEKIDLRHELDRRVLPYEHLYFGPIYGLLSDDFKAGTGFAPSSDLIQALMD